MGRKKYKNKSKSRIFKQIEQKKSRHKSQMRVNKLIEEFCESTASFASQQNDSVIILDDTLPSSAAKKRKLSDCGLLNPDIFTETKQDELSLILDDDTLVINNDPCCSNTPKTEMLLPPIDCSTPISKRKPSTLSNNNNTECIENFNDDVTNLTKEINRDSYLTIDLTTESCANKIDENNTIIDVDQINDTQDCAFVSASIASLSTSIKSNISVLQSPRLKRASSSVGMHEFVKRITKLHASEKGKLLELITQKIFNGCKVPKQIKKSISEVIMETASQTSAKDTYIKEVIIGEKKSRNSIGSNIYNPKKDVKNKTGLRMIVIDGSNVAMEHSKGREFSVKGLQICIDYFLKRGHAVKAFVPRFRCKFGKSSEPRLLDSLERRGLVVYTPSREIRGRFVTSYDDRYIVQCAAEFDGVIVSGDNYRDLLRENPRWQFVIENRLLQFTWVEDMLMFPRDPLGKNGPTLEQFLKHEPEEIIV